LCRRIADACRPEKEIASVLVVGHRDCEHGAVGGYGDGPHIATAHPLVEQFLTESDIPEAQGTITPSSDHGLAVRRQRTTVDSIVGMQPFGWAMLPSLEIPLTECS